MGEDSRGSDEARADREACFWFLKNKPECNAKVPPLLFPHKKPFLWVKRSRQQLESTPLKPAIHRFVGSHHQHRNFVFQSARRLADSMSTQHTMGE